MAETGSHPSFRPPSAGVPETLALLPVSNRVLFPGTERRLHLARPAMALLDGALSPGRIAGIFVRNYDGHDGDTSTGLCRMGVAARIDDVRSLPGNLCELVVHPFQRVTITRLRRRDEIMVAEVAPQSSINPAHRDRHWQTTVRELKRTVVRLAKATQRQPERCLVTLLKEAEPDRLADLAAAWLDLPVEGQQDLLEELDVGRRVRAVLLLASDELKMLELQRKIRRDTIAGISERRRRAYLNEQLKIIRRELGENLSEGERQARDLTQRLGGVNLPPDAKEQAQRELRRLALLRPSSAEFPLMVNYVETLAELPWSRRTRDNFDLARARAILDRDHYDLDTIKRRIIEHLAVRRRSPAGRFPMLCLLGPPGVGKSSLGKSIAVALGRKFACLRLGGVRDEAEVVGTRWSQPGATPGRIMRELQRVRVANPVMMLDEIDQIAADTRGDPVNGLIEIIDSAANEGFVDRFLNTPFDVSRVLFIATASYAEDIAPALRSRLQIVRIPGYSDDDKREIARRYLVPRQIAEYGLTPAECRFDSAAIEMIIQSYTREAGVLNLERHVASLCRAVVAELAQGKQRSVAVTPVLVEEMLGPPRYLREPRLSVAKIGVVTGLAWTNVGGEIMLIEALRYPGKGFIQLTGQIGGVMKESAHAALSLLKTRAGPLGIKESDILDYDLHVHVPAGAVPKDGPSAGVAIFTAIASLWTGREVRADVAMTGEITLRGLVLPIGGLKEKILAAQRAGILTVILPKPNEKDLADVPAATRNEMKFVLVESVDEVLAAALVPATAEKPKKSRAPVRRKKPAAPSETSEPMAAAPSTVAT